jgi:hypothetical protein
MKTAAIPIKFAWLLPACLMLSGLCFAQTTNLTYRPIAAEYSAPLNRIVMIAAMPDALYLHTPGQGDTAVPLERTPLSLAISPDGLYAAVGHDRLVSYVNLSTATVERAFMITVVARNVTLSAGWIYAFPGGTDSEVINLSSGAVGHSSLPLGGWGKMNPSGTAMYGIRGEGSSQNLVRLNTASGFITRQTGSIYNGEYSICAPIFFSASGDRIYTRCGTVFTASDEASSDMRYAMTLPSNDAPFNNIGSFSESVALRKIATVGNAGGGAVALFDRDYLTPAGSVSLLPVTQTPFSGPFPNAMWVTFNASSTALHVLVQVRSPQPPQGSGVDYFAVQTLSLAPPGNCGTLPFPSISATAEGLYNQMILNGSGCLYQSVSLAPWIKILNGANGPTNRVTYLVRANTGPARTGQILVGGHTFTINQQSGFAEGPVTRLPYNVLAAEYSRTLDKLIAISDISGELHIYDPVSRVDHASLSLPRPPLALALSSDGLRAAVLHDGFISFVNLSTASILRVFPIPVNASSITLGSNWAYALGSTALHSSALNLETGAVAPVNSLFTSNGRHNAAIGAIYGTSTSAPMDLVRFDTSAGPITSRTDSPYSGEYPICGPVFFSPAGDRIYTGCGSVFRASSNAALDMRYATTLSGAESVRSLTESSAARRVALIQAPGLSQLGDNKVLLYESDYLNPLGEFHLSKFPGLSTVTDVPHGQSVFFDAGATNLYVLVRGGGPSAFNSSGVQTIPLAPSATSCGAAFSETSASPPASGSTESVSITSPINCVYQAVSTVPWIQILSGGYGTGDRVMHYIVRPNSGGPRTGAISIGNADLIVTQAGTVSSGETHARLSYAVTSAAYSKTLDKLILTASSPSELHVYDARTQSDQMVALPAPPLSLVLSPDGNYAAVGHDGWISYVDLRTPAMTSIYPVSFGTRSLLLTSSRIYGFNPGVNPTSIQLSDASTATLSGSDGTSGKLSVDGRFVYIDGPMLSKWAVSDGSITTPLYSRPVNTCGLFWLTEDGRRMITSCGRTYHTSSNPFEDLQASGSLSTLTSVLSADQSTITQSIAVLPFGDGQGSTQVGLYDNADPAFLGNIPLPPLTLDSDSYPVFGRFVSWNRDGNKVVVLVKVDDSLERASPFAVSVLSPLITGQIPVGTSERGSFSTISDGNSGAVSVGHATVRLNPGSSLPAGLAIFGARINGVLVSEATVPATRAVFSGRIYAEVDGPINTGIAFSNPNISPATVRFAFTDQSGVNLFAGSTTIPARGQIARFLNEEPFNALDVIGTMTFISDIPVAAIALRSRTNERGEALLTTLPVAALGGPGGGSFLFPSLATGGGWTTQFVLVNPDDVGASGTLRFYSQGSVTMPGAPLSVTLDGQMANTFTYSLPPNSSRNFKLSGPGSAITVGSARVTANPGQLLPSGVAIFSQVNNAGVTITEAGVPAVTPFQAQRLYVEASNNASQIQSGIALANDTASAVTASLELFDLSGMSTGLTGNLPIPANGQVQLFLNQIPGFQNMPAPFKGVLRITGDFGRQVSVIGLRTRVNERGEFLITTTNAAPEGTNTFEEEQHFPHFADGGGYRTQFILMNVSPTLPFAGVLEFYSQGGIPLNLAIH